jgi:quinol monooxygenase YgiN
MAYVLVARLTAREGEQDRAAELIGRLVEATRTEPGNVHYIPHRDPRTRASS